MTIIGQVRRFQACTYPPNVLNGLPPKRSGVRVPRGGLFGPNGILQKIMTKVPSTSILSFPFAKQIPPAGVDGQAIDQVCASRNYFWVAKKRGTVRWKRHRGFFDAALLRGGRGRQVCGGSSGTGCYADGTHGSLTFGAGRLRLSLLFYVLRKRCGSDPPHTAGAAGSYSAILAGDLQNLSPAAFAGLLRR